MRIVKARNNEFCLDENNDIYLSETIRFVYEILFK